MDVDRARRRRPRRLRHQREGRRRSGCEACGDFLVAAYRRPEFRVDVTLKAPTLDRRHEARTARSSASISSARAMASRPVKWTYSKAPIYDVPHAIRDKYADGAVASSSAKTPRHRRDERNDLTRKSRSSTRRAS